MDAETRKHAVMIAAARAPSDWDGKRSPRLVAGLANAANLLASTYETEH